MASSLGGKLRVWAAKSIPSEADEKLAELQLSRGVDRLTVNFMHGCWGDINSIEQSDFGGNSLGFDT